MTVFDDLDLTLAPIEEEPITPIEVETCTHKSFSKIKLELCNTHEEYESYSRALKLYKKKQPDKIKIIL